MVARVDVLQNDRVAGKTRGTEKARTSSNRGEAGAFFTPFVAETTKGCLSVCVLIAKNGRRFKPVHHQSYRSRLRTRIKKTVQAATRTDISLSLSVLLSSARTNTVESRSPDHLNLIELPRSGWCRFYALTARDVNRKPTDDYRGN